MGAAGSGCGFPLQERSVFNGLPGGTFMIRRLQINILLYCFLWHLIWLFSCSLFYLHDNNACCVKNVPFAQSINYRPIVAVQSKKVKQAAVSSISLQHHPTDFVSTVATFHLAGPDRLATELTSPEFRVARAYTPSQSLPSRASPA